MSNPPTVDRMVQKGRAWAWQKENGDGDVSVSTVDRMVQKVGICVIHPNGSHEPLSIQAAVQRDSVAFQAFADEVSHEVERLKSEQMEPTFVGLLVQLSPRESFVQAVQRGLLTWQKSPMIQHH